MVAYPEAELFLTAPVQITGNGTASTGPALQHERWEITHIGTSSNSSTTSAPVVVHYRNFVHPSMLLEGTYSGNLDNDTSANFKINSGDKIVTVVSGADPGATTWVRFEGKRFLPYKGYQ